MSLICKLVGHKRVEHPEFQLERTCNAVLHKLDGTVTTQNKGGKLILLPVHCGRCYEVWWEYKEKVKR